MAIAGQQSDDAREILASFGQRVMTAGLSAGTGGNISARDGNLIWMKPSGFAMDELSADNLCGINIDSGEQVAGGERATSEVNMHLAVYRRRPDVHAVFHVHPPWLSGVVSSGREFKPLVSEAIFYLGRMATIPYITPTTQALADAMGATVECADTVFMPKHGMLAVGGDMREAFHRCVVAEDAAKAIVAASVVGTPCYLTDQEIRDINELSY